jgi:hypothetical protein
MWDFVKFVLSKINSEMRISTNIHRFLCEGLKILSLKLHDFEFKHNVALCSYSRMSEPGLATERHLSHCVPALSILSTWLHIPSRFT